MAELDRAWLVSALVLLADNLAAENYFDRAPILEMVRHLRNGVSHGNRFEIRTPDALLEHPAHTRGAACISPTGATFEITPELHGGPVLFDFMGPGDVLDVLISVGTHLLNRRGHPTDGSTAAASTDTTREIPDDIPSRELGLARWLSTEHGEWGRLVHPQTDRVRRMIQTARTSDVDALWRLARPMRPSALPRRPTPPRRPPDHG
ncbi:MAG: hypothetical protein GXX79_08435 [Actinomycetales bacterium]|nr:hypothetical protein [Actinomycetales bacterium]